MQFMMGERASNIICLIKSNLFPPSPYINLEVSHMLRNAHGIRIIPFLTIPQMLFWCSMIILRPIMAHPNFIDPVAPCSICDIHCHAYQVFVINKVFIAHKDKITLAYNVMKLGVD